MMSKLVVYQCDREAVICSKEDEEQIVKEYLGRENGRPPVTEEQRPPATEEQCPPVGEQDFGQDFGLESYVRREFPKGVAFIHSTGLGRFGVYE